jgi:diadenosine tetraphosphate (Ap4A) HIT family hydrolase
MAAASGMQRLSSYYHRKKWRKIMDTCPFCATYKDLPSAPGGILYEDDLVYAYHSCQNEGASYLGHLLLLPKRHALGFADLTAAEGQAIGLSMACLSKALTACTGAEKIYVEAYYEVNPHLHLILTARYPGTPREYWRWKVGDWPEAPTGGPEAITAFCVQLRAHLAQTVLESVGQEIS